jgi:hypothetical protein
MWKTLGKSNTIPEDIFQQRSQQEVVKDEVVVSPPRDPQAALVHSIERLAREANQETQDTTASAG